MNEKIVALAITIINATILIVLFNLLLTLK